MASGVGDSGGNELVDVIVVGGGSAGCAMAARLAENDLSVLLLEAGGSDRDIRLLVPALTTAVVHNPAYDWGFPAEPDPSVNNRADKWPAGKRLGGGSAINGMIYVRGHRTDYDRWAELGAKGWSGDEVAPYFARMETSSRKGEGRGSDGPISVTDNRVDYPIIDAFIDAAVSLGVPRNPDHNGAVWAEGADHSQATQRDGMRCSSARGYLRRSRRASSPRVMTQAVVRRILVENGRATGVEFSRGGTSHVVRVRHGVVVSAGTLNTPRILMLSGIGPADHLATHGIKVIRDLPGVGSNLQEHVGTHVIARVRGSTINSDAHGLPAIGQGLDFLLRRRGAITSSMCHAQAFVHTRAGLSVPDMQISFTAFAFDINEVGRAVLYRDPAVSLTVCLGRPQSRGTVRLRSSEPDMYPVITHQLLGSADDLETLARGMEMARSFLKQEPLAGHIIEEVRPGPSVTDDALRDYLRSAAIPLYHPVGTCRMGTDQEAVVDPDLKVHGIDNLWVADASVMPTLPIGNTNASAIMIGDKGADHVLKCIRREAAAA